MANNYIMSNTGYSVEVTAFYDTDLSRMYFDENFISEKNEMSLMYTGCEHSADDFIITVTETAENRSKALSYGGWEEEDGVQFETCDALCYEVFYDAKTIYDKLTEYTRAGLKYDCNFSVIISCGYSQGDARYVFVLNEDAYVTREMIDRYLWDAPITARVTINGEEVLFEDEILGDDFYKWDQEGARKRITDILSADYSTECIAEVIALIPVTPDYI